MTTKEIFQDWRANSRNPKARLILAMFRIAKAIRFGPKAIALVGLPYLVFYRVAVEWILGVELPWGVKLGRNARIFHGVALVVNDKVTIGNDVILRHSTTIGVGKTMEFGASAAPIIGDRVDIGSNVVILGSVRIGDDAIIGAGSVVVKDVPPGATVVGNPARILPKG